MHEVRELAGLVAGKEQARAAHKEDLRRADVRAVDLVVHDDGACEVQRDIGPLLLQALLCSSIGLTECATERDGDAGGQVVEVLLLREVRDLARDRDAGRERPRTRDLAEQIEASLCPQQRTGLRLVREDDVGLARPHVSRAADRRDE